MTASIIVCVPLLRLGVTDDREEPRKAESTIGTAIAATSLDTREHPFGRIGSIHTGQFVYSDTPGLALIRRRILVVEDDPDLRQMYRLALSLAGFEVMGAGDGIDALWIVEQHLPDVIVLDLGLPLLDGLAVRQEIASKEATRHIPIVVVTGLDVDPASLDVPWVLRKPVTPDEVVRIVWHSLGSSLSHA